MGSAVILHPVLESVEVTPRGPEVLGWPKLTYACALEYRAWVHVIRLDGRGFQPMPLRDARNVLCRALLDLGTDIDAADAEARAAIRRPRAVLLVGGVTHRGVGADGARFRVVAVDIQGTRIVVVVPATQREISIEVPGL